MVRKKNWLAKDLADGPAWEAFILALGSMKKTKNAYERIAVEEAMAQCLPNERLTNELERRLGGGVRIRDWYSPNEPRNQ